MDAIVATVVNGIAINMLRIQRLGIRHIMVANIAPGACMPYSTLPINNSTACIANDTINTQTMLHNSLLEDRVKLLNKLGLHGADIIIVNMTKAFQELFHNGEKYGEASCDDCYGLAGGGVHSLVCYVTTCVQRVLLRGQLHNAFVVIFIIMILAIICSHCHPTLPIHFLTCSTHRRD